MNPGITAQTLDAHAKWYYPLSVRKVLCDGEIETWVFETTILPDSVRINEDVDNSLFTISPYEAGLYVDLDNPGNNMLIRSPKEVADAALTGLVHLEISESDDASPPQSKQPPSIETPLSEASKESGANKTYLLLLCAAAGFALVFAGVALTLRQRRRIANRTQDGLKE